MSDNIEVERLKVEMARLEMERARLALIAVSLQMQRKAMIRKNRSWIDKIGDALYDW